MLTLISIPSRLATLRLPYRMRTLRFGTKACECQDEIPGSTCRWGLTHIFGYIRLWEVSVKSVRTCFLFVKVVQDELASGRDPQILLQGPNLVRKCQVQMSAHRRRLDASDPGFGSLPWRFINTVWVTDIVSTAGIWVIAEAPRAADAVRITLV
jgi:hypothetical protein